MTKNDQKESNNTSSGLAQNETFEQKIQRESLETVKAFAEGKIKPNKDGYYTIKVPLTVFGK